MEKEHGLSKNCEVLVSLTTYSLRVSKTCTSGQRPDHERPDRHVKEILDFFLKKMGNH